MCKILFVSPYICTHITDRSSNLYLIIYLLFGFLWIQYVLSRFEPIKLFSHFTLTYFLVIRIVWFLNQTLINVTNIFSCVFNRFSLPYKNNNKKEKQTTSVALTFHLPQSRQMCFGIISAASHSRYTESSSSKTILSF